MRWTAPRLSQQRSLMRASKEVGLEGGEVVTIRRWVATVGSDRAPGFLSEVPK